MSTDALKLLEELEGLDPDFLAKQIDQADREAVALQLLRRAVAVHRGEEPAHKPKAEGAKRKNANRQAASQAVVQRDPEERIVEAVAELLRLQQPRQPVSLCQDLERTQVGKMYPVNLIGILGSYPDRFRSDSKGWWLKERRDEVGT